MSRAVIFDLDGTLIDSAPDIHAAANTVMARHGLAPFAPAEILRFVGHGAAHFIACCLEARGLAGRAGLRERMLAEFLDLYDTAVTLTRPYPGAVAALERLAGMGLALGVCTNKPERPARAVLAHLGLDARFAVIVGGDTTPARKPDPAPLRAALAALDARAVAYVGDSEVDAETAARADVPFALYTEGYRKAPVSELPHARAFGKFEELPGIVPELLDWAV